MAQLDPRAWTCPPGIPARQVAPLCQTFPPDGVTEKGYVYAEGRTMERRPPLCPTTGCLDGDALDSDPRLWPTATARDWRSGKASAATRERNSRPLSEEAAPGGYLNPPWVERHMGFPEGWTEVPPGTLSPRKRGAKAC
jgi:hypothetical protein